MRCSQSKTAANQYLFLRAQAVKTHTPGIKMHSPMPHFADAQAPLQLRQPVRQKSPLGTNRDTVSCPAMVVNTWFNAVIGTAWEHMVPLATEASGTE